MAVLSERRVTALVVLLVAAALFAHTFGRAHSGLGAFSPMFFPRIVLGVLVGVAALDLLAQVRHDAPLERPRLLRVAAIAGATIVFLYAMPRLGFFLSALPFALFALIVLGLRRPLAVAGVAVGVPGALVALFNHLLVLPLPTSPFTWWF